MVLDIGPASVDVINRKIASCRTLLWNGPLGAFELPPFDAGTNAVALRVAELTHAGDLMSIAGGGDTLAALAQAGVLDQLSYVSTAGGAFLEWLEGKELPGVAVAPTPLSGRRACRASEIIVHDLAQARAVLAVAAELGAASGCAAPPMPRPTPGSATSMPWARRSASPC